MLKNYLTIAIRNLRKQSFYSLINIFGLSVGVAICMVIAVFVINEYSYDRHFSEGDRIYRFSNETVFGGDYSHSLYTPASLARVLPEEFPEVEAAVHFLRRSGFLVKREDENIREDKVVWTSKDFFKVFDLPLLEGNKVGILDEPNTMAISKSIADKYFPNESVLGKSLILDNNREFRITGVYQDLPQNTHFHFEFLLSAQGLPDAEDDFWLSNNFQTYFILQEGADSKLFEEKLPSMLKKYIEPQLSMVFGDGANWDMIEQSGASLQYHIQPIHEIHLNSDLDGEFEANFDLKYVYIFISIGLFILLIACINFMNLSTARSANRAKEVGIRKVMGSFRSHLIGQFLLESILITFLSFLLAIPLATLSLPIFNELADRSLIMPFDAIEFYLIVAMAAVFTGILAGSYPSFFLSAFKPISILKGKVSLGMKTGGFRSTLVVFQFAVSVILIIATITVNKQLNYIQNKEIGFKKDQIITVYDTQVLADQGQVFKDRVMRNSMIQSATFTGFLPVDGGWRNSNPWIVQGRDSNQPENNVSIQNWVGDNEYVPTLGMEIVSGRNFSYDFPSDSSGVILNESAVKQFAFEGDPIGQQIYSLNIGGESGQKLNSRTVVGIVKDFNFQSLKRTVSPVMIMLNSEPNGPVSFKFHAADTQDVIAHIEGEWNEMAPGQPFTYTFLDDQFGKMYSAELRLGKVFAIFAGFTIFIACLGLFALTAFTAEQRTKEIGIRKVLGATSAGIVVLLSKEFSKLVLFGFVIASPLAWWAMSKWLDDYQYKVDLGLPVFLTAGLFVAGIAMITISFQAMKAAASNPVNSLKSE